jgi:hypothetical protein
MLGKQNKLAGTSYEITCMFDDVWRGDMNNIKECD